MRNNWNTILVTGGARSGKSSFAERLAQRLAARGTYIATAQALDAEMDDRVAQHRRRRDDVAPGFWATLEEPLQLAERLRALGAAASGQTAPQPPQVVLVDCLTLWLSNHVLVHEHDERMEARIEAELEELEAAIRQFPGRLVLVTNEVGNGIVPAYKLGRVFRDLAGRMNQRLARICDRVFLVTAGIPIELKSLEFRLDELDALDDLNVLDANVNVESDADVDANGDGEPKC